jgi:hypothetical protein
MPAMETYDRRSISRIVRCSCQHQITSEHDGRAARFFTLVSRDTREEEFAHHRKLFLTEQGYSYQVHLAEELRKAR